MAHDRGFVVPYKDDEEYHAPLIAAAAGDGDSDYQNDIDKQGMVEYLSLFNLEHDKPMPFLDFLVLLKKNNIISDELHLRRVLFRTDSTAVTARRFAEEFISYRQAKRLELKTAENELQTIEKLLQSSETNLQRETSRDASLGEGSDKDSKLTVQIVSIHNFQNDPGEGAIFKVLLECQNQAIETKPQVVRQGTVFWNEMFSFQIESKEGDLHITVIKVDLQEVPTGDASIMIEDLADQRRHEMSREIWGATNCELLVSAQWVFSKSLLHQSYVREFNTKKERKLQEIAVMQNEVFTIETSINMPSNTGAEICAAIGSILEGPEALSRAVDRIMANLQLTSYQVVSRYIVAIGLFLACIACCARPVFLDLCNMSFAIWCNIDPRRWSAKRYALVLGIILFSCALDLVWIVTYFNAWKNSAFEADMQNVTKLFSLLNIFWKVTMFVFLWKCCYDMRKKRSHRPMPTVGQPMSGINTLGR